MKRFGSPVQSVGEPKQDNCAKHADIASISHKGAVVQPAGDGTNTVNCTTAQPLRVQ